MIKIGSQFSGVGAFEQSLIRLGIEFKNIYGEVVHHIDFIKTNNDIKNLYLCRDASEHAKIHQQYRRLRKEVGEIAIIIFENGLYKAIDI